MTRDEIIKLAQDAGCGWAQNGTEHVLAAGETQIERFAALVAAAEREACAKVCEEDRWITGFGAADAIRARGEK